MNTLLAHQLGELLAESAPARDVLYEDPLRVAASTLLRAAEDDVSATTVVGIVGADDLTAFEALVQRIADESGLDARIRLRRDAFSVRFSRRARSAERRKPGTGPKALLLGLVRG